MSLIVSEIEALQGCNLPTVWYDCGVRRPEAATSLNAMTDALARLLNVLPASAVPLFPNRVVLRAMQLMAEDMARLSRV